jgi:hypothetical protein
MNEAEAETVRLIFQRYLALGTRPSAGMKNCCASSSSANKMW